MSKIPSTHRTSHLQSASHQTGMPHWIGAACIGIVLACGTGCAGGPKTVDFPAHTSVDALGFSLEPSRPEEQFSLAQRFTAGDGVKANDFWAEYWAWRAARQGYQPALTWLDKQARLEKRDQPAVMVYRSHRRILWERPSAQLLLAMVKSSGQQSEEDREAATSFVELALPAVEQKALRGDTWGKYLLGLLHDVAMNDPEGAFPWYAEAAELGHVLSQDALGRMYDSGRGVPQDSQKAMHWFRLAADQGYAPSATMLGWLYDHGRGVAQDPKEAAHWFTLAAQQGDALAQANLGILLDRGRGTPQDPAEAARWYQKAAEQRVAIAENNLGLLYDQGRGVAKNEAEATRWFQLAVSHGFAQAQNNLAIIAARRNLGQGDPSLDIALVARAAVQGDVAAQYDLGQRYDRGQGVNQDPTEAARWYQKAAEKGHPVAQTNLGVLYYHGRGVAQNHAEAARLFGLAATRGNADAEYNLGTLAENGLGVAKDPRVALEWYRRAAASGNEPAQKAVKELECQLAATTEVFGALLLCATRDGLQKAARAANATVLQELPGSPADIYESDAVLGVRHAVRVEYTGEGRVAVVTHELPESTDARAIKRIEGELAARYGEPVVEPKNAAGEVRQKWVLRDGAQVEYVRGPGNKGSVAFKRP